jgi:hypothetical protein
LNMN